MPLNENNIISQLADAYGKSENYVQKIARGERDNQEIKKSYKKIKGFMDNVITSIKAKKIN